MREAAHGAFEVRTIDGNSGSLAFSPFFDMSHGRKIGYDFIYQPRAAQADRRLLAHQTLRRRLIFIFKKGLSSDAFSV
ncbi:MAG TPA: hypothetical protein VF692_03175 [Pyrinomonadaceae bacterium]